MGNKVTNKGGFDLEDNIGVEILITSCKNMRHKLTKTRCLYHKMNVLGAKRMALLRPQHLADGSIVRNGVGGRPGRPKAKATLAIESAAERMAQLVVKAHPRLTEANTA